MSSTAGSVATFVLDFASVQCGFLSHTQEELTEATQTGETGATVLLLVGVVLKFDAAVAQILPLQVVGTTVKF